MQQRNSVDPVPPGGGSSAAAQSNKPSDFPVRRVDISSSSSSGSSTGGVSAEQGRGEGSKEHKGSKEIDHKPPLPPTQPPLPPEPEPPAQVSSADIQPLMSVDVKPPATLKPTSKLTKELMSSKMESSGSHQPPLPPLPYHKHHRERDRRDEKRHRSDRRGGSSLPTNFPRMHHSVGNIRQPPEPPEPPPPEPEHGSSIPGVASDGTSKVTELAGLLNQQQQKQQLDVGALANLVNVPVNQATTQLLENLKLQLLLKAATEQIEAEKAKLEKVAAAQQAAAVAAAAVVVGGATGGAAGVEGILSQLLTLQKLKLLQTQQSVGAVSSASSASKPAASSTLPAQRKRRSSSSSSKNATATSDPGPSLPTETMSVKAKVQGFLQTSQDSSGVPSLMDLKVEPKPYKKKHH